MTRRSPLLFGMMTMLTLAGSVVLVAQETPATVQDPISPADCLRDKKKAPDCLRLGVLYAQGKEVPQDLPRALELLDAACRAGLSSACWSQGWTLLKRHASPEDVKRGSALLENECHRGASGACMLLGRAYAEGTGVARDVGRAVKPLETACTSGQEGACVILAKLLDAGDGIARDAKRASALFSTACVRGATEACEKACASGDGVACRLLGDQLSHATSSDASRIERADQQACDAGAAEGCYLLALRAKDDTPALTLAERACALDYAPGCLLTGHSYYLGRGTAADLAAAARFYAEACEKGMHGGCSALGGMYARGELGADETAKGQAYLVKACGEDVACQAIVANGRIPKAWGGSLDALRPQQITRRDWPVRVGNIIKEPQKIRNVTPAYPAHARAARIQGTVTLDCVISPRGDMTDVRFIGGPLTLRDAAVEAVRQWRYTPTLLDGMPVPVIMTVTVNFTIS